MAMAKAAPKAAPKAPKAPKLLPAAVVETLADAQARAEAARIRALFAEEARADAENRATEAEKALAEAKAYAKQTADGHDAEIAAIDKERDKEREESISFEERAIAAEAKLTIALRILEDAGIDERDLEFVENSFDPIRAIRNWRSSARKAA